MQNYTVRHIRVWLDFHMILSIDCDMVIEMEIEISISCWAVHNIFSKMGRSASLPPHFLSTFFDAGRGREGRMCRLTLWMQNVRSLLFWHLIGSNATVSHAIEIPTKQTHRTLPFVMCDCHSVQIGIVRKAPFANMIFFWNSPKILIMKIPTQTSTANTPHGCAPSSFLLRLVCVFFFFFFSRFPLIPIHLHSFFNDCSSSVHFD